MNAKKKCTVKPAFIDGPLWDWL